VNRALAVRGILGTSIVGTVAIVAVADVFNATHLFNPDWPGHARFHIGMQFTTLVLVSAVSLWALSGPLAPKRASLAALAPATFWPGLFAAYAIPGTDVYASDALRAVGVPVNLVLAGLFLGLTVLGVWLVPRPEPLPIPATVTPLKETAS
jgi:hypothetical protein